MNRAIESLFALYEKAKQARGEKPYTAPADEEYIQQARDLQCQVMPGMDIIGLLQAILEQVETEVRQIERAATLSEAIAARRENMQLAETARTRSANNTSKKPH